LKRKRKNGHKNGPITNLFFSFFQEKERIDGILLEYQKKKAVSIQPLTSN